MNFLLQSKVVWLLLIAAILGISGCSDCYGGYSELNYDSIKNSANEFLQKEKKLKPLEVHNPFVPEFYNPIFF